MMTYNYTNDKTYEIKEGLYDIFGFCSDDTDE